MIDQAYDYNTFVAGEVESGGGDFPESGNECLNEAMSSNWTRVGSKVKTNSGDQNAVAVFSVVALWTDDNAHPPGYAPSLDNPNYPPASRMPRTYAGMQAKWKDESVIPQANKLLAFFTPVSAPDSGYLPIKSWDRFLQAGTLTDGTRQMVDKLADAVAQIAGGLGNLRITQ
jgi:hypothetical protein